MSLLARIEGGYQELVWRLKPAMRALRLGLSLARFHLRRFAGLGPSVRVVPVPRPSGGRKVKEPAVAIHDPGMAEGELARFLSRQTETSWTVDTETSCSFLYLPEGDLAALPATHLESLLLVAAALDLDLAIAAELLGGVPGDARFCPLPNATVAASQLQRFPAHEGRSGRALGAVAPQVGPRLDDAGRNDGARCPGVVLPSHGPWLFDFDDAPRGVVRQPVYALDDTLRHLAPVAGSPTVLFLLPYLAVGGAEHLLFDLLAGLAGMRTLVVTTEPHRRSLGQTVDRARELTPHVYTLGDWLPREALDGAIRHLLRRYQVETLFCWNGCSWFYDRAAELRRHFPSLRIVNQLYNHRGGWIARYRPSLMRAIDCHVAVNRRIAEALGEHGAPRERTRLIYHGVEVPEPLEEEELRRRREERRRELGLPLHTVVVGSFIRLHPQKRPLDIVRLARRLVDRPVTFLLVGGGPYEGRVAREIAADPPPNLVRLPMRRDPRRLYDAVDVCLSASSYEGLPIFLLEGLARGLPCVATAVGDVPVLLERGGGLMAEPGNLDGLEAGILTLLDPQRRRQEGARGRHQVAERFGLDRYRREYVEEGVLRGGPAEGL